MYIAKETMDDAGNMCWHLAPGTGKLIRPRLILESVFNPRIARQCSWMNSLRTSWTSPVILELLSSHCRCCVHICSEVHVCSQAPGSGTGMILGCLLQAPAMTDDAASISGEEHVPWFNRQAVC